MSESTIPFQGQTAVLDRPLPDPDPVGGGGGSRSKLFLLTGLAAVLVMAVAAYFLFVAGGEDAPVANGGAAVAGPDPAPAAEAPAAKQGKKQRIAPRNFGRDPFKPLIVEAPPAAPVGAAVPVGQPPLTGSTGSTGGTTTVTVPETTTPAATTSHSFRVLDTAPDNGSVTVKVDGETYRNLKAGEVFADFFKVVLIGGQVNSFQYGEEKFNVIGSKRLTIA